MNSVAPVERETAAPLLQELRTKWGLERLSTAAAAVLGLIVLIPLLKNAATPVAPSADAH